MVRTVSVQLSFAVIDFLKWSRYVYQVVVPKALAPKDLVQVYESGEKIVLPAWDPMVRRLCSIPKYLTELFFQGALA